MSKKEKKPSIVKVKVSEGPSGASGTCHCSN